MTFKGLISPMRLGHRLKELMNDRAISEVEHPQARTHAATTASGGGRQKHIY